MKSNSKMSERRYSQNSRKGKHMETKTTSSIITTTNLSTSPSSSFTSYSNDYQNYLNNEKLKAPGKLTVRGYQNQNQSSNGQNYSLSAGTIGIGLESKPNSNFINATNASLIDADFSDHFVVRRQTDFEQVLLPECDNDNFSGKYTQARGRGHDLGSEFDHNIFTGGHDDHSHEIPIQSQNDFDFVRPTYDGDAQTEKDATDKWKSGNSNDKKGKRSNYSNADADNGVGVIDINSLSTSKSTLSRPLYMFGNSGSGSAVRDESATAIRIPGRARAQEFIDIDSSKIDHEYPNRSRNNINPSRNSLSVLRPFTAGEVSIPSSMVSAPLPSHYREYCHKDDKNNDNSNSNDADAQISRQNCSKYSYSNSISMNNEFHDYDYRQAHYLRQSEDIEEEGNLKSKNSALESESGISNPRDRGQGQDQVQTSEIRRLPSGFYSQQYLKAIKKNSGENHNHYQTLSQVGIGIDSKCNSKTNASRNMISRYGSQSQSQSQNQNQSQVTTKPTHQSFHSQIPTIVSSREKQSQPNVYRNSRLNYTPNYIPLVPSSTLDSNFDTSYCLKANSKSESTTNNSVATPTAAAKGDASSTGSGSGSGSVAVDIPESLVTSNPATTSSMFYMRPKTVSEDQVSYTQKLSMDSMIKSGGRGGPIGHTGTGLTPYFQQKDNFTVRCAPNSNPRIQSQPAQLVIPHHDNVMSSSQVKSSVAALSTGYQPHPQSQKLISSKNFRNELTSPLGPFHIPIRPFLIVPPGGTRHHPREPGYIVENEIDMNTNGDFEHINVSGISPYVSDLNIGNRTRYNNNNNNCNLNNLRHSIFHTCSQTNPIPIHMIFDYLVNIRKVGEGVYGEVFKAYFRGLPDQRVYKIVPIEGSKIVNGEKQKKFGEVEPEIIVSQELNKLRCGHNGCYTDGHCRMLYTRICQGKYPATLVEQWKSWHRSYVSQNDLPDFDAKQLYTIFEFEYHGTDIESFKFRNAKQSMAVLLHVIHSLAAAESAMEFEHRDLHWGNILVLKTRDPFTSYTVQGTNFRVPNCGLKSTIIDYTISRLTSTTGQVIFTDLADDEDQFCGSEDYQFEIYRMMREENKNDWSRFCPKTNIFWAHYLVGKLIDKGRYIDTTNSIHTLFKNKLLRIQTSLLKYQSCSECIRLFLPAFCRDLEATDI